jgi:hypothetical protein
MTDYTIKAYLCDADFDGQRHPLLLSEIPSVGGELTIARSQDRYEDDPLYGRYKVIKVVPPRGYIGEPATATRPTPHAVFAPRGSSFSDEAWEVYAEPLGG